MLRIHAADVNLFNESRAAWNALVLSMRRPSVFCTWEWIDAWLRIFGSTYRPVILFAYRGDTLVGIIPLALKAMCIEDGVVPGRTITFCGSRELYPDHMDVIASAEHAVECMHAAMRYLSADFKSWTLCTFPMFRRCDAAFIHPDGISCTRYSECIPGALYTNP